MARLVGAVLKLSAPETRQFWQIPVLWQDEHLLALDKPSGLPTSPDRCDPQRPSLMKLLHRGIARGAAWARERRLTYLANTHRLDVETSGVVLLARDKPTLVALADQFGAGKAVRTCVALIHGSPPENTFEVEARLAPHPARPGLVRVDARQGKKAKTLFEVGERFSGYTLLNCQPLTDRTHQVRAHLRHVGCPIVGDSLYGGRPLLLSKLKPDYRFKPDQEERALIGRVALHAGQLNVAHPVSGAKIAIAAPWPRDLTAAVKYLRRFAGTG